MIGRAAYPIRPGLIIQEYLLEHGGASISELHRHYKRLVREENARRARGKEIKPMHGASFRSYFHNCGRLGLVRAIGEKPIEGKRTHGLLSIRGTMVVPSTQVIYELTSAGRSSDDWMDPVKALGY